MATTIAMDERALSVEGRMETLEDRIDALTAKSDAAADAVRGDLKLLLDRMDCLSAEIRREVATVRKEHWSDHRLVVSMLKDRGRRLDALERSLERVRDGLARGCGD